MQRLWLFGKLIANTDMHDGNLSYTPGLELAPAYDMLPMAYAPGRGIELQEIDFQPMRPLPSERDAWQAAALAANKFWQTAEQDARISDGFRANCAANARKIAKTTDSTTSG